MIKWNGVSQIALDCLNSGIRGLSIVTPDVAGRYADLDDFVKTFGADGSVMRLIVNTSNGGRLMRDDRLRIKIMLPSVSPQSVRVFHQRDARQIWVVLDVMPAEMRAHIIQRCQRLFCPPIEVEKRETERGTCYLLKPEMRPNRKRLGYK